VETTLTLQESRAANDADRLAWQTEPTSTGLKSGLLGQPGAFATPAEFGSRSSRLGHNQASLCKEPIVLDSLDIRTFTFGVRRESTFE
jgi:hypothetical protein